MEKKIPGDYLPSPKGRPVLGGLMPDEVERGQL